MIQFPCHCSYTFRLEPDMAGTIVQCPKCGRLNDVPLLSDLEHINPDGTFKLDDSPQAEPPGRGNGHGGVLNYAPPSILRTPGDDELDLRPSFEDVLRTGEKPPPDDRPQPPRYDPITGELIRPIEVEPPPPPPGPQAPFARRATAVELEQAAAAVSAGHILLELLSPVNILVMFVIFVFVFGGLVASYAMACALSVFGLPRWPAALPLLFLALAHYGNVIDETGREARPELPRPLRDLSWGDDIWGPFSAMFAGLVLCYAPAVFFRFALESQVGGEFMVALATAAGTFFAPATWLVLLGSGTILNLRPDRLLRTIAVCSWPYLGTALAWAAALALHGWAIMLGLFGLPESWQGAPWTRYLGHSAVIFPMLFVGVYLMHFVCWHLGSMYNRHPNDMPWVLQRHVPDPNRLLRRRSPTHLPPPDRPAPPR